MPRRPLLALAVAALSGLSLAAQSVDVRATGDVLHLVGQRFTFIKDDTLGHLKDGRALRINFTVAVLPAPTAAPATSARHSFVLSYDLWEERFAVTAIGPPSRAISHLTARSAEAWCMDRLTVPLSALGRLGRDAPFWIRLEYRVEDPALTPDSDAAGFSLGGLIDSLSRRRKADAVQNTIDAGPFRLSN